MCAWRVRTRRQAPRHAPSRRRGVGRSQAWPRRSRSPPPPRRPHGSWTSSEAPETPPKPSRPRRSPTGPPSTSGSPRRSRLSPRRWWKSRPMPRDGGVSLPQSQRASPPHPGSPGPWSNPKKPPGRSPKRPRPNPNRSTSGRSSRRRLHPLATRPNPRAAPTRSTTAGRPKWTGGRDRKTSHRLSLPNLFRSVSPPPDRPRRGQISRPSPCPLRGQNGRSSSPSPSPSTTMSRHRSSNQRSPPSRRWMRSGRRALTEKIETAGSRIPSGLQSATEARRTIGRSGSCSGARTTAEDPAGLRHKTPDPDRSGPTQQEPNTGVVDPDLQLRLPRVRALVPEGPHLHFVGEGLRRDRRRVGSHGIEQPSLRLDLDPKLDVVGDVEPRGLPEVLDVMDHLANHPLPPQAGMRFEIEVQGHRGRAVGGEAPT